MTWFDTGRGFGFISRAGFVSRDDGGTEVFVHHSQISGDSLRPLGKGDRVSFTLQPHERGLRAADVHPVG
ncbi:cold-shock protein [Actinophytocola algeriensis]|uniref:CspA family cold shock protein n=1 Tax=Actinophytocola algeriensis TaxID=1768010 RepID=A0A7W7QAX5_9PSEU|nr:cold shock domain-containing protein [Actinophytocola algeriensis]MBB4910098.1 CspA family cold shock protein [Actinophytocola algeriensis]MBE1480914.1 CspA family cold shock protein [Actinophytocola algeriensis]